MGKGRVIFHVDMNSFYASVEMADRPELKGKPVAIAGAPEKRKGIIVTSSYEARAKGVKTTMPLWKAYELCPELIALRPNFEKYREASRKMFSILYDISPIVQPVSIDEGYLDVTEHNLGMNGIDLAKWLQNKIYEELDLPCSIGIAPNKFLAKMASDMKKPMGITVLRKREIKQKLWVLPVGEMYGVGERTEEKLKTIGVHTIGDLAQHSMPALKQLLGINGERLHLRANGHDNRPVDPDAIYEFKSIGNSSTLPYDTTDRNEIDQLFDRLAERVSSRLAYKDVVSENIQIMIRYYNRTTITRSKQLRDFVESKDEILQVAKMLFDQHWNEEPVRLLGITAQQLVPKHELSKQLDLFTYEEEAEKEKLYQTVEEMKEKFGDGVFLNTKEPKQPKLSTSFQKDFLSEFQQHKNKE